MRKINSWPVLWVTVLLSATSSLAGDRPPEAGRVLGIEHFGSLPQTAVAAGDYVYVLCHKSLRVYNASSRNRPYLATSVPVTQSMQLIPDGNRLILDNGVVDISDPAAPVQVATWGWSMHGWHAEVYDGHLFRHISQPAGSEHIAVYDLADVADPVHVADIDVSTPFVISRSGIMIHQDARWLVFNDVSDPTSPVFRGTLHLDRDFDLRYATVEGDFLYLLADGLMIVDMHDPALPTLAGSCSLNRWEERPVVVDGGRAYAGGRQSLDIFDIQDPTHPFLVRRESLLIENDPYGVRVAALQGTVCTVRNHHVSFYDCSAATSVLITRDRLWSGAELEGVVQGNAVFDLDDGWVMLTDTKLSHKPTWIHHLGGRNTNAEIVGPYLALAGQKRELFDISNAAAPVSLGFDMDLPWGDVVNTSIGAIHLWDPDGLTGWSTEAPGFPVQAWTLPMPFTPTDAQVLDDLLFIRAGGALESYRIESGVPTSELGVFDHGFDDFAVRSWWDTLDMLYLARGAQGLELWRCNDGVVADTEPYAVFDDLDARSVQCSGAGLFVQHGAGGLRIFDVSDPGTPTLVADFDLIGPSAADSIRSKPLIVDYDLIVGGVGDSRARIFKNLLAGVVPNEPGAPDDDPVPTALVLGAAYPNPFNPSTSLSFDLPTSEHVRLAIHDARGRLVGTVFDGRRPAGRHTFRWAGLDDAGRPLPSGLYIARLVTDDEARSVKLTLAR